MSPCHYTVSVVQLSKLAFKLESEAASLGFCAVSLFRVFPLWRLLGEMNHSVPTGHWDQY